MPQSKDVVRVHHLYINGIAFSIGNQTDLEGAKVESHRDGSQLRHELEGADGDALDGEVDGVARRAVDRHFYSFVVPQMAYLQNYEGPRM